MFNLSGSEIIFLILIALVVLGPDKLPDAMRKAGKAYGDFKRMTSGFQNEMKSVLDEPMRELRETADLAKSSAMFDTSSITKPLSGLMADVKSATVASGNMPVKAAEPPVAAAPVAEPAVAAAAEPASEPAPEPSVEPAVVPAAEFLAAPATNNSEPAADVAPARPAPALGDATSRRLARMQQPSLGGNSAPSADPGPAEGASVE